MERNRLFRIPFTVILGVAFVWGLWGCKGKTDQTTPVVHDEFTELQKHFMYTGDGSILVSGHRGGLEPGFPENSLEGFKKALEHTPLFFEIDPRLTKDSVIVLMHDATLDRTTNATGKVSDYTWEELQTVRLKDHEGNVTPCKIPTLEEVILWSKGKTVVNLDKKDVPMRMIVDMIRTCDAEQDIMLTVHTGAQARYYYDRFPRIMLSVFACNDKEYEDIAISGVPFANMIAYVGPTIDERNESIVQKLRSYGVRCMISVAPTHDRKESLEERSLLYQQEIDKKPDIIESDYPVDVANVLNSK